MLGNQDLTPKVMMMPHAQHRFKHVVKLIVVKLMGISLPVSVCRGWVESKVFSET